MRLTYVLLSPTWGMHQYTADLAGRMADEGHEISLITTRRAPLDRYPPGVAVRTPISTRNTGFGPDALRPRGLRRVQRATLDLRPDLVHLTGPHLWNPWLLRSLRRAGVPTVHSLHDLHPHQGAAYGRLLYLWNGWVQRGADHLLVHGQRFRDELLASGLPPEGVTCTLLTHLFLSYGREQALRASPPGVRYEPWALFLGRMEAYKGLEVLIRAARGLECGRVLLAGPGRLERCVTVELPPNVEVRNLLVVDEEAIDLFARCGLVVLPYVEASQSALVAAAYFFRKPVVVTRAGALPEYVVAGETGWLVPPGDAAALAQVLESALSDAERLARMGRAGRAWYERQRRAEAQTLLEMYAHLL